MRGSESRSIAMVLLCLAGLLCTSQARAQEERSREGKHRFSFLMLGAGVGPGPTDDFKKALIRAGFGDDYQWPGGSVRPRPISQSGSGGLGFEIGYEHPSAWGLVLSAGRADFGWAKGFRAASEAGEEGQSLVFRYSLRHISPAVTYRLGPLRASLGPSVVQTRAKVDALGPAREIQETIKVGLEASAGVSTGLLLPYLQLGVRARYRLVGSPELGPFNAYDGAIPSFKVNFNHWQVGVGLGLRVESRGTGRSPLSPDISQPGSFADLARIAGKDAANSRRTFGYSAASFIGGLPIGIWGPYFKQADCLPFALSGVAIVGLTSVVALKLSGRVPGGYIRDIENEDPLYQNAFRDAYREELRRRQMRAILRGAVTGAVAGLGLLLLLLPAT